MKLSLSPTAVVLTAAAVAAMATVGAQYATAPILGTDTGPDTVAATGLTLGDTGSMLVLTPVPECGPESESEKPTDWITCVYANDDPWEMVQYVSTIVAWKTPTGAQHVTQVVDSVVPCDGEVAPILPSGGSQLARCYWDQDARGTVVDSDPGSRYVIATVAYSATVATK